MMKIGLLTSHSLSKFRLNTLKPILDDNSFKIELAIIDSRPKKTFKQKVKKNIKRGRGGYIIVMALKSVFSKKRWSISVKDFCSNNKIDIIDTDKPYAADTIEKIKKYNLDVLLLIDGYGIVKEQLLKIAPYGILSYHHGDMRKYRGMPPALWELYNNEREMGVTVQILAPGLDNGIPIEEKTIEIKKNDTLKKLENRASEESIEMLYNALKKLSDKDFKPVKIDKFGEVYTLPNLRQWLLLNIKITWRIIKFNFTQQN